LRTGWLEQRFILYLIASVSCIIVFQPTASSQALSGVPGYVTIPVATFHEDGTLVIGSSFMPHQHLPYTENQYDAVAVFANLTFLAFVEVDLRMTRILGLPKGTSHVADRVPTIRFRLLQEKKWIPAVTLGFHDILTSIESGSARHFGASYMVVTKNFHLPVLHLNLGTTAGWGTETFIWRNDELIGFFGGISLSCDKAGWARLLFDYNGTTCNAGLRFTCFRRLTLTASTIGFNSLSGTVSYSFNLIR
jgi:hypothetical protein